MAHACNYTSVGARMSDWNAEKSQRRAVRRTNPSFAPGRLKTGPMKRPPISPGRAHASYYHANREQRLAARALAAIKSAVEAKNAVSERNRPPALANKAQEATKSGVMAPTCGPIAKQIQMRSEAYRRAVASLPCAHCGIEGYSQHAHENDGKGKGMKVDDRRAMPLCCTRPGIEGCHAAFDGYHLLPGRRSCFRIKRCENADDCATDRPAATAGAAGRGV